MPSFHSASLLKNLSNEIIGTLRLKLWSYRAATRKTVLLRRTVWNERAAKDPLLDLSLFCDPRLFSAIAAMLLAFLALSGNNFLLPFYLVGPKGAAPQTAGIIMATFSAVFAGLNTFTGRLADRVPPARLCAAGMFLAAASFGFFSIALPSHGFSAVLIFLLALGIAYSLFISPCNTFIMNAAPVDRQGIVSGVLKTASNLGLVLGVCLMETIFSEHADATAGFRSTYLAGGIVLAAAFLFSLRAATARTP